MIPRADPNNKNAFTDMFFKPKKVQNLWDQSDKWWNNFCWGLTTLPAWIWLWNSMNYTLDDLFIEQPDEAKTYPSMYRNFLTSLIMATDWGLDWIWPGIFKYYDMFSIQGWNNYFWDFLSLITFFWPI